MGIQWKHFFIVRTVVQGQDLLRGLIRDPWDTFQSKLHYVTIILCNITAWFKSRRKPERLLWLMVGFYFSQHCRGRCLEKCAHKWPAAVSTVCFFSPVRGRAWASAVGWGQALSQGMWVLRDPPCSQVSPCELFSVTQRDGDILAKEEDWSELMLNSVWDFGFSFEKLLHSMQMEQKPVREMEDFYKNIKL